MSPYPLIDKLRETWGELLSRDADSPILVGEMDNLLSQIRACGVLLPPGLERDRLQSFARHVSRGIGRMPGQVEPEASLLPYCDGRNVRIYLDGMPPKSNLFVGRQDALKFLDENFEDPKCRIVQIIAHGGQGKTQLVNQWIEKLQADPQGRFGDLMCYSFYTFPSHTFKKVPLFIQEAREFFLAGNSVDPSPQTEWSREIAWLVGFSETDVANVKKRPAFGDLLEKVARERPKILVLDGLEACLVHRKNDNLSGWSFRQGALQIQELLQEFLALHRGFCVITSRFPVGMLVAYEPGLVRTFSLEGLDVDEGAEFLEMVLDNGFPKQDLKTLSRHLSGHPLSLLAYGDALANQAGGALHLSQHVSLHGRALELREYFPQVDVDRLVTYGDPLDDPTSTPSFEKHDRAALSAPDAESLVSERVDGLIRSYMRYFAAFEEGQGRAGFELVRILAFYQEMASIDDLFVLIDLELSGEEDPGFNSALRKRIGEPDDENRLRRLVELLGDLECRQLIQQRSVEDLNPTSTAVAVDGEVPPPTLITTHPLLRQSFRDDLIDYHENAWRKGHLAICRYLERTRTDFSANALPEKVDDFRTLYRSVEHACQAEEWGTAFDLYWDKIHRNRDSPDSGGQTEDYRWHAWEVHGLQNFDIRTLAFFHIEPKSGQTLWQSVAPSFRRWCEKEKQEDRIGKIRIATAFCLTSLGYLSEAASPLNYCYRSAKRVGDNLTAAMLAGIMGDRFVLQGKFGEKENKGAEHWLKAGLDHAKKHAETDSGTSQIRSKTAKLGNLRTCEGRWEEARDLFKLVVSLHEDSSDAKGTTYPCTRSGYYLSEYLLVTATTVARGWASPEDLGCGEEEGANDPLRWALARVAQVESGTRKALAMDDRAKFLNRQDKALNHLSLARAEAFKILFTSGDESLIAERLQKLVFGGEEGHSHLNTARTIQEDSGARHDLPRTLIVTARMLQELGRRIHPKDGVERFQQAMGMLHEVLRIVWEGEMKLFEADVYLTRCSLFMDLSRTQTDAPSKQSIAYATSDYGKALDAILNIGYLKRSYELAALRNSLGDLGVDGKRLRALQSS